jgi:peptidyl-tRNA hydrolase, PTH1 family
MKLIVGLGNPGEKYHNTRHNAGFLFLDALREKFLWQKDYDITDWNKEKLFNSELSFLKQGSRIVAILQKPLTYMNRSGDVVAKITKKFDIEEIREDLILVHDDLDLPLGKFKIQVGKAPLGHNGVRNVEERLGTTQFKRIRIGVENRGGMDIAGEDYVLLKFLKSEREIVDEVIQEAISGILSDILIS